MPPARLVERLADDAQTALQERYRTTHDADERSRCQMLLFSAQGKTVGEIAALTFFGADTVLDWLDRYAAEDWMG